LQAAAARAADAPGEVAQERLPQTCTVLRVVESLHLDRHPRDGQRDYSKVP